MHNAYNVPQQSNCGTQIAVAMAARVADASVHVTVSPYGPIAPPLKRALPPAPTNSLPPATATAPEPNAVCAGPYKTETSPLLGIDSLIQQLIAQRLGFGRVRPTQQPMRESTSSPMFLTPPQTQLLVAAAAAQILRNQQVASGSADDEAISVGRLSVAAGPRGDSVPHGSLPQSLEPMELLDSLSARLTLGESGSCTGARGIRCRAVQRDDCEYLLARVGLESASRLTHSASAVAAGRDTTQKQKSARDELPSPLQQSQQSTVRATASLPTVSNFAERYAKSGSRPPECNFCRNMGKQAAEYVGHKIHDGNKCVMCPELRRIRCQKCGATGDYVRHSVFLSFFHISNCKSNISRSRQ